MTVLIERIKATVAVLAWLSYMVIPRSSYRHSLIWRPIHVTDCTTRHDPSVVHN
jgi:hypothetical protein